MASGSTYAGTLDSYVDKMAGDFLTIADVNNRSSAIEKLETGPLRPNDGSEAAPAYAFRSSASSGVFYSSGAATIGFTIGGFLSAAILKTGSAVNYIALLGSATGTGAGVLATGTDSNVDMLLQTKSAGGFLFAPGGTIKVTIDSTGRLLMGAISTTGSGAGDIILGVAHSLRSVNNAGTSTVQILGVDTNDRLLLGGSGITDIVWGPSLVALGGGSTATLGATGSPGPVSNAAQNSWMQVRDSSNALFWVPVWK